MSSYSYSSSNSPSIQSRENQMLGKFGLTRAEISVIKTLSTNRKTFKTLHSVKEAVWPVELDCALFGGLKEYAPSSTRVLQRFPRRNKYLAEFILKNTGKRRTAKQVGSRLQQIKETTGIPWVIDLISSKDFSGPRSKYSDVPCSRGPKSSHKSVPLSSYSMRAISEALPVSRPFNLSIPTQSFSQCYDLHDESVASSPTLEASPDMGSYYMPSGPAWFQPAAQPHPQVALHDGYGLTATQDANYGCSQTSVFEHTLPDPSNFSVPSFDMPGMGGVVNGMTSAYDIPQNIAFDHRLSF